ncbi:unnamed protein product, partial [Meganyctiphanes norvegica]
MREHVSINYRLPQQFHASDKRLQTVIYVNIQHRITSDNDSTVSGAVTALHRIFTQLLTDGDIVTQSKVGDDLQSALEKYGLWLHGKYKETLDKLLTLINHEGAAICELALCCMVKFIQTEGCHPLSGGEPKLPTIRLHPVMETLLSDTVDHKVLISRLQEYLEYQDFIYSTLHVVGDIVSKRKGTTPNICFMNNLFCLLEQLNLPNPIMSSIISPQYLCSENDKKNKKKTDKSASTKAYAAAERNIDIIWMEVIRYPLTVDLYRRSLVHIPDKVMPHLKQPILLCDFFMESYNLGGGISLLALQGVFILVAKHNLEYPDFYVKLYALLEPTVFHAKYRPRFFMLCDNFLSSTHLPEYLVAAFIKRFARLALVAPSSCLVLILKFIANILIRYRSLQRMINNPEAMDINSDPFIMDESDPAKCHAMESSLWEVATLKQHALPNVARACGFLDKNLPEMEYDISQFVENTYEDIFERAAKMKPKEVPTTFHKPLGIFEYNEDQMSDTWSIVK